MVIFYSDVEFIFFTIQIFIEHLQCARNCFGHPEYSSEQNSKSSKELLFQWEEEK